ncbi:MAG: dienelactone hydrolase family protein [Propionibacteriaceae bacterium]|nr:dienelactone hydrolase family protein [Propionibacteriaceae bacterium]
MNRLPAALLGLALLASVTACATTDPTPVPAPSSAAPQVATLGLDDMAYDLADASGIAVHDFNLGNGTLTNGIGKPVPCPLTGIIAAPTTPGPHPVVMVIHGVTQINGIDDAVYAGFDYLIKQLAAEGYVALAPNMNVEYSSDYGESNNSDWAYSIYQQHLAALARANDGVAMPYGVDLAGKLDLSQIHLMGHSRGGQVADALIRKDAALGTRRVRSLVLIESTAPVSDDPHPDVPTGIILGEYDGDVPEAGQSIFDAIRHESGRTTPASLVFLRGANHAFFNRAFTNEDGPAAVDRLSREQQERFLTHYASAFLSVYAKGRTPFGIWDPSRPQPVSMFGYPVVASSVQPGHRTLLAVAASADPAPNADGGASIAFVTQKRVASDLLFNHPGVALGDADLPLYRISWDGTSGSVSLPLTSKQLDGTQSISLFVAVDSSDSLNPFGQDQSFTLTLRDYAGGTRSVRVPIGTSALSWHSGQTQNIEGFDGSTTTVWSGTMPLGELRVPLRLFAGVELHNIAGIDIALDQTERGAVMLSGISAI